MFNTFKAFMYKHRKILNMFSLITVLCASLTMTAYADVGNFSSSASSHPNISSSHSTHSNSSNSFNHSNSSSNNSNSNNVSIALPFLGFMILFMGSVAYNQYKKISQYEDTDSNNYPTYNVNNEQIILEKISTIDENFDINKFKARTGDMFMSLQQAWMKKDWRIVRPYESDNLFNMHSSQLQQYINKNQTNMMENICVKHITLKDFYSNPKTMIDSIEVIIEASFIDYVKDDRTGKVISGDSTRPIFMRYKWTLIRKSGVKSKLDDNGFKSTSCPNCGAPISIGASGECEYCHSTVTSGDYDWILSSIEV